jgi:phosphatidate cytidylyltransferase
MALSDNVKRIIVAIVAIPLILLASYFGSYYFFAFVLIIGLVSYYEFVVLIKNKNANANLWLGLFLIALLITNQFKPVIGTYTLIGIALLLLLTAELFRNKNSAILNLGATLIGLFYIGLFSSFLIALREFYPNVNGIYVRGGYIIISMLASIWICDSAAYYGGTAFGKHKLFPRVSPKKSWEGAIFGFIFAVGAFAAAKPFLLDFLTWKDVIILGVITGVIGQLGDLVESLLKRDAGVKDSSGLIPGHGGMFDRFDSLLFSSPVIWLYLKYFS